MEILVFNCGSSSLTFRFYRCAAGQPPVSLAWGKAHRVGAAGPVPSHVEVNTPDLPPINRQVPMRDHGQAAAAILETLPVSLPAPDLVGHRFVHGGAHFSRAAFVDPVTMPVLESCLPLAPIHNPASMSAIRVCLERLPAAREYVAMDTTFHAGIPDEAAFYPLAAFADRPKSGFHGLSYSYVLERCAGYFGRPADSLNLVMAHLGTGGSSACCVRNGKTLDTTMGFTPLPGLVMSTRCGDLESILVPRLCQLLNLTPPALEDLLNRRSGVLGLSGGVSSDLRDLHKLALQGDKAAARVIEVSASRTAAYCGAYAMLLPACEALVFTDDLGSKFPALANAICAKLSFLGVKLAPEAVPVDQGLRVLSAPDSAFPVLAVDTDEELLILREGLKIMEVSK